MKRKIAITALALAFLFTSMPNQAHAVVLNPAKMDNKGVRPRAPLNTKEKVDSVVGACKLFGLLVGAGCDGKLGN